MGEPRDFTVVELGAGRREMAEAFAEWNYVPVDIDSGAMPEHFVGVVFSNEFFDALPVDAAVYRERRLPRTARRAGRRRVRLAHRRSGWRRRGTLPAPLLPAATRKATGTK